MKLIKAILDKAKYDNGDNQGKEKNFKSPPPEVTDENIILKRKTRVFKYEHVKAKVDSSPPRLDFTKRYRNLEYWQSNLNKLCRQNYSLMIRIRKAQLSGGKVDCHWSFEPRRSLQYYKHRVDFLKRVYSDNLQLYKRIISATPRVASTASLRRDWKSNRKEIVLKAENAFVLFPPIPQEIIEDAAFITPTGVSRPRVYMTIGIRDSATIGELCFELFTDVCPQTCRLFTELLDGDKLGHGYVGTCFFRKVPHLYWSGGDVIHNSGFGCYVEKGWIHPICAENCHFSHSMPGLLSMNVTCDNEVCGTFNITFKALPQFDLKNVVFGRVIRPSLTYNTARVLGNSLSSHPVIQVNSTRRLQNGRWVTGQPNIRLSTLTQYKARQSLICDR